MAKADQPAVVPADPPHDPVRHLGVLVEEADAVLAAYQAAGLYPPDDATIKFIARERGWLR